MHDIVIAATNADIVWHVTKTDFRDFCYLERLYGVCHQPCSREQERCTQQTELQIDGIYLALDLLEYEGQVGGEVADGYTPKSLRGHSLHLF